MSGPRGGAGSWDEPSGGEPLAQHRQVIYNLATWSPNERGELVAMLAGRGISHDWRTATTLVVADLVESEVDGLIGTVHGDGPLLVDEDGTKRTPSPNDDLGPSAPLLLRGAAFLIDSVLMAVAWWAALVSSIDGSSHPFIGRAVGTTILGFYFIGFVTLYGRTPGKMAVRLKIVDVETGAAPGPLRASVRFLVPNAFWVLSLSLGLSGPADTVWQVVVYGVILLSPRRRGLHDMVAGTLVVLDRPR